MSERKPSLDTPSNRELLESLLSIEGSSAGSYSRLHRYSPRNIGFLALQGCPPEPIATYKGWEGLGGHVKKGSKAFSILRPIMVRKKDEEGEPTDDVYRRFKVVKAIFPLSMTEGAELPPYEHPEWSTERALGVLGIQQVAFESYESNMQGYSFEKSIAVNPIARYPFKTLHHELGHVVAGHTAQDTMAEYVKHRGLCEFEAEATAHLTLKELGADDQFDASESRHYIQTWLQGDTPPEQSFRSVLNATGAILKAGRVEPEPDA